MQPKDSPRIVLREISPNRLIVKLAGDALRFMCRRRDQDVKDTLERIQVDCDGDGGVGAAMQIWIDAYTFHLTGLTTLPPAGFEIGGVLAIGDGAEDDPGVRWAIDLITARIGMDSAAWRDTLARAPDDPEIFGGWVVTLLQVISDSLQRVPAGISRPIPPGRDA